MTDEQQETIVNEALRIFCKYLNLWWNSEPMNKDEQDPYTPEKFTITDYDRGLYGETGWVVLEEPKEGYLFQNALMRIDAADGDEGGGNILYVGLQGTCVEGYERLTISWIMHEFDTTPYNIYADGKYRTPPNGEFKELKD
jgi:hypothetical protein